MRRSEVGIAEEAIGIVLSKSTHVLFKVLINHLYSVPTVLAGGMVRDKSLRPKISFYIIVDFLFVGLMMLILACPEHSDKQPLVYETDVITGKTLLGKGADGQKAAFGGCCYH